MMPKAVKWLLIVNVAAYLVNLVFDLNSIFGLYYVLNPNFKVWQPLTYMFMHGGTMHLFFNMFALWMFGRIIEPTLGTTKFLIYYFVCGLGGAIFQEAGQLMGLINPYAMTIGASGAVYGILLAFGVFYPNERMFIIPIPFPIKAKWFVIGYGVIELMEGLMSNDGVAHFAHLAGMLFGLILILYWKNSARRSTEYFTKSTQWKTTSTRPNMEVHYNKNEKSRDWEYNAQRKADGEEIDRILEKVRQSGYGSLSESEKQRLFDASKR